MDSRHSPPRSDDGSAMPLIIGMVVCLLLLGAGVTAATSAFLARANLQHVCDGAAAAASEAQHRVVLLTAAAADGVATAAASDYVRSRGVSSVVAAGTSDEAVDLACSAESAITFGALFGAPTISLTVHSIGRAVLPPGQ